MMQREEIGKILLQGGLGNQMFQYALARSLSIRTGRKYVLDIISSLFFSGRKKCQLYQLNVRAEIITRNKVTFFLVEELLKQTTRLVDKVMHRQQSSPLSRRIEKDCYAYEEDLFHQQHSMYLEGYFQNENYFKNIRSHLLCDFIPKKSLSKTAERFIHDMQHNNSVCIHVRRGDYLHPNQFAHHVCDISYYERAVLYIERHVEQPHYYIFSDDISWCQANFSFLHNKVFIEGTQSDVEDLEIMKYAQHYIIANSSFSWWGAWLSKSQKKIVINPAIWLRSHMKKSTPACEGWINLDVTF